MRCHSTMRTVKAEKVKSNNEFIVTSEFKYWCLIKVDVNISENFYLQRCHLSTIFSLATHYVAIEELLTFQLGIPEIL